MTNAKKRNQAGVSYVELLAVIVIIGIVSALAIMNIGSAKKRMSRQTVARELKNAFERARFDSVKRRVTDASPDNRAKVSVSANSFVLSVDETKDNQITAGDDRSNANWNPEVQVFSISSTAPLAPVAIPSGTPVVISFDRRGEISTSGGQAVFLVCNGDCSTPDSSNSNLILVTQTGTVNLLPGGSTIPNFAAPNVSNVAPANSINNDMRIN